MRLAEARRLKPGDRVVVEGRHGREEEVGKVVHATKRGGVLVEVDGESAWVPYGRVHLEDDLMRRVSAAPVSRTRRPISRKAPGS